MGITALEPNSNMNVETWTNEMGMTRVSTLGDGHCQFRAIYGAILQIKLTKENRQQINKGTKNLERLVAEEFFNNIEEEIKQVDIPMVKQYLEKQQDDPISYNRSRRELIKEYFVHIADAEVEFGLEQDYWGGNDTMRLMSKILQRNIYVISECKEKGIEIRLYSKKIGRKNKQTYYGIWNDGNTSDIIKIMLEEMCITEYHPIVVYYDKASKHYETVLWDHSKWDLEEEITEKLEVFKILRAKKTQLFVDFSTEEEDYSNYSQKSSSDYSDEDSTRQTTITPAIQRKSSRLNKSNEAKETVQENNPAYSKEKELNEITILKNELEAAIKLLKKAG